MRRNRSTFHDMSYLKHKYSNCHVYHIYFIVREAFALSILIVGWDRMTYTPGKAFSIYDFNLKSSVKINSDDL